MEIQHAPPKRVLAETSFSKTSSMDTRTPSEKSINSDERRKAESSGDHSPGSMDAFNEVCFGIHSHDYVGGSGCEVIRSIGEVELMGDPPKKLVDNFKTSQPDKINSLSGGNSDFPSDSPKEFGPGWSKVVEEITEVGEVMATDPRRAAILDDLDCMGFSKKDLDPSNEVAVESDVEMVHESVSAGNLESWAKGVNSLNNPKNKGLDEVAVDEVESVSVDFTLKNANGNLNFPEFQNKNKLVREKRYASLLDIQDKVLNAVERKKRDRNIKKLKKKGKFSVKSELEGRSLSDSDLKARWDHCISEAKRTLKVGKDLGIQIRGNENEVVEELAHLEELDINFDYVTMAWRPRGTSKVKTVSTLFVCNISEKLHWKCLWAAFGHHGDVIDAFIPKKKTRNGKRFGFVRFATREDADQAMARLNGFVLFGSKIEVSFSRYEQRTSYWKKVSRIDTGETKKDNLLKSKIRHIKKTMKMNVDIDLEGAILSNVPSRVVVESRKNPSKGLEIPKVRGSVDEEALWKLQQCFVGFTFKESESSRVHEELCKIGLGELRIKRMAGRVFLLEVKDKALLRSLQDTNWERARKIFCKIQAWVDDFIIPEQMERINRVVTLEVGKTCFPIGVSESTFNFPLVRAGKEKHIPAAVLSPLSPSVSSSGSSSVGVERPACSFFGTQNTFNDAFKDGAFFDVGVNTGKADRPKENGEGSAKQKQLTWADIVKQNGVHEQGLSLENFLPEGAHTQFSLQLQEQANDLTCSEQRGKSGNKVGEGCYSIHLDLEPKRLAVVESDGKGGEAGQVEELGVEPTIDQEASDCELGVETAEQNWADSIDELNINNHSLEEGEEEKRELSEGDDVFIPDGETQEEQYRACMRKTKGKKKYGSLRNLQDGVLSEAERKKQDRILRKLKRKGWEEYSSGEIDEASLTSSDLHGRWKLLTRKATKLLEFGSRVGFQGEGDMNEAVSELARVIDRDE
ncbi:hypothetical protein GQ457_12G032140 [Hibiscus cannabinus]